MGVVLALILTQAPGPAAPCLPPGVPALSEMRIISRDAREAEGVRSTETYLALRRLYEAPNGRAYDIYFVFGRPVIVDDHPEDASDTAWWIDPDAVTDDIPPKVKSPESAGHCAWRKRGDPS